MSESVDKKTHRLPSWVKPALWIGLPLVTVVVAGILHLGNAFGPDLKFGFAFGDYMGFDYSRNKTTGAFPQTNYLGISFWVSAGVCSQTNLNTTSGRQQWEITKVVTGITNSDGSVQEKKSTLYVGQNFMHTTNCP